MVFFEALNPADFAFLYFAQSFENNLPTLFFSAITFFGNPAFWFLAAAWVYWSGRENNAFHLMNIVLLSSVVVGIMKTVFARPRPSALGFRVLASDYFSSSFPSGHAAVITAYFSYLQKKLAQQQKALFALLVVLVLLSRVYLGAHFLSDVIAGALVGFFVAWFAVLSERKIKEHHFRLTKLNEGVFVAAAILLAVAALFFVAEALVFASLLGFYAGFFLSKEFGVKAKKLSAKKMLAKQAIGFLGLGVLAFPQIAKTPIETGTAFAAMFLAGFWVSFLWPWVFESNLNSQQH